MLELDTLLFLWLNASGTSAPWVLALARFGSLDLPEWLAAGMVGAFVVGDMRVKRGVLRVVAAMTVAWFLARLGQNLFPMPRPSAAGLGTTWLLRAESPSFPSTHASVAFAFAGAVMASTRRWLFAFAALVLAGLVGWSRICLGLHFPVDVVAGAAVGGASAWLSGLPARSGRTDAFSGPSPSAGPAPNV